MLQASCHCGAVRIEVAETPQSVTSCNCSLCRRYGTLWAYYHPDQVRFVQGLDATEAYVQGERMIEAHHCRTCGCVTHWRSTPKGRADRMAVNARLMDPAELEGVPVKHLDGADTWTYLD